MKTLQLRSIVNRPTIELKMGYLNKSYSRLLYIHGVGYGIKDVKTNRIINQFYSEFEFSSAVINRIIYRV